MNQMHNSHQDYEFASNCSLSYRATGHCKRAVDTYGPCLGVGWLANYRAALAATQPIYYVNATG